MLVNSGPWSVKIGGGTWTVSRLEVIYTTPLLFISSFGTDNVYVLTCRKDSIKGKLRC